MLQQWACSPSAAAAAARLPPLERVHVVRLTGRHLLLQRRRVLLLLPPPLQAGRVAAAAEDVATSFAGPPLAALLS